MKSATILSALNNDVNFETLSDDILLEIFSFLDLDTFKSTALVSTRFNAIVKASPQYWKQQLQRLVGNDHIDTVQKPYKDTFVFFMRLRSDYKKQYPLHQLSMPKSIDDIPKTNNSDTESLHLYAQ
jgi:hypothetical protein